jgi:mono/diheme cytochrome c family protein
MKFGGFVAMCGFAVIIAGSSGSGVAETLAERGAYLVNGIAGCGNCHTPRGGPMKGVELAGGFSFGGDKAPFKSYAANITPDRKTGIGAWTDAQLVTAIREGKRPDGSVIGPPMAIDFYKYMSDRDAKAIVAYLRSVKPVKHKVPKSVYRIPLHAGKPVGRVADVSRADKIAYGDYQVRIGHCMECHTPMVKGRPDLKNRLGAGGRNFEGPWGEVISANITQDKATGIGGWTDAQIKRAIRKGVRHDGTKLRPPMCFRCYVTMTAADMDAVVSYLRTVKPVRNNVR